MENVSILLVDDEEEFVKALAERLSLRGFGVRIAFSGEQALGRLEEQEPTMVVLDLKMPGMDGMEVLRRARKSHPRVAVVMLTGHGSDRDREEAMRLGAYAYLQKPVQIDQLVRLVKDMTSR
ncbi:MAG TPA: response regulator [Syntrophobacteraceae bacterium]|jgi:two-component system, OmpR family, response regulator CpxR|nr:response regulator [Syntrophobacteraceae bacterium]HBD10078.1 response regulator [Syntrophobacteraceae bacterium]HBZ55772.1 response regulator [Syntrophobacteraceae bacterium]